MRNVRKESPTTSVMLCLGWKHIKESTSSRGIKKLPFVAGPYTNQTSHFYTGSNCLFSGKKTKQNNKVYFCVSQCLTDGRVWLRQTASGLSSLPPLDFFLCGLSVSWQCQVSWWGMCLWGFGTGSSFNCCLPALFPHPLPYAPKSQEAREKVCSCLEEIMWK